MNEILIATLAVVLAPTLGVILAGAVISVNALLWAGAFFCVDKTKQAAVWFRRKAASRLRKKRSAGEKE